MFQRPEMAFSPALRVNLPAATSHPASKLCPLRFNRKQSIVSHTRNHYHKKKRKQCLKVVRSVLDNRKPSVDNNDNEAAESVRVLLERVFMETQKLEEQIYEGSSPPDAIQMGFDLEVLGSDLQAVLAALRKKEEDLKDAESVVMLEREELDRAKQDLERQEEEIAAAQFRKEKLENDLKQAHQELASQVRQIEDLKLMVNEKDTEIVAAQLALTSKEEELDKMRNELIKKIEEASKTDDDLKSKDQLLNEANEVIQKQTAEIQELQKSVACKEQELEESTRLRKAEKEKLMLAEASLQKQTVVWLSAQEELKKVTEEAQKHMSQTNETLEDFRRVKKLLSDVRSELVSSQKSLASSRRKMEEQEDQLQKQVAELEEQKQVMVSHMKSLEDANKEVEKERSKLRVALAQNKELEQELSLDKHLIEQLQDGLHKERSLLKGATAEIALLQKDLDQKNFEFREAQNLLQEKEAELVEARLQIQRLKSEQASIQLILDEKDSDLLNAKDKIEELSDEISQLRERLISSEAQLIEATTNLQEKQELVCVVQNELDDAKIKYSEVANVLEQITELTNKLITSAADEYDNVSDPKVLLPEVEHMMQPQSVEEPAESKFRRRHKQLEMELELTRESLRAKEMEALAAERALTLKDEEIKTIINRLEERERELNKVKQDMLVDTEELKKLYLLVQESSGNRTIGDLATEKLQLEVTKLELEAATDALCNLANMSTKLLKTAGFSADVDIDKIVSPRLNHASEMDHVQKELCFVKARQEVARLSALTEELVKEAGIVDAPTD